MSAPDDGKGQFLDAGSELIGERSQDEDQNKEIEGIECPAEEARQKCIALCRR
jgi:hypothetical protein